MYTDALGNIVLPLRFKTIHPHKNISRKCGCRNSARIKWQPGFHENAQITFYQCPIWCSGNLNFRASSTQMQQICFSARFSEGLSKWECWLSGKRALSNGYCERRKSRFYGRTSQKTFRSWVLSKILSKTSLLFRAKAQWNPGLMFFGTSTQCFENIHIKLQRRRKLLRETFED